jgi:hypothetical protein
MLLCKVYDGPNGKSLVTGSCNIRYYDKDGWFPIESVGFGVDAKDKGGGNNRQGGASAKRPAVGGAGARPTAPPPAASPQKGASDREPPDETKISISKLVDTGTCDLMFLAMRDRNKPKGQASKIQADIHLLSVVDAVGSRWSYPNLMIHLEGVLVTSWRVNASGDERAEEELELKYDRVAMKYVSTKDAKEFMYYGPRGWDQYTDEPFTWAGQWNQYLDHLSHLKPGK